MQMTTITKSQRPQHAIGLYNPTQVYELEKHWFKTNDSVGLMRQAAWQLAHRIKNGNFTTHSKPSVLVAAGSGNNGGDAWLVAAYLTALCPSWSITVLEVAAPTTNDSKKAKQAYQDAISNTSYSNQQSHKSVSVDAFLQPIQPIIGAQLTYQFDLIIDGLFGIGLDREPVGDYQTIIDWINDYRAQAHSCQVISIDVPSGLNAATGAVYNGTAIHADITLCLIARKAGLHLGNSKDHVGHIIDVPMLPITPPTMYLHTQLPAMPKRQQVSHKGTYGHVLIIGGNRLDNGHGMAGAAILAASAAFASGVGKVTVACHRDFHPAIISALPNAMTADLHQVDAISELINTVDVVAIGMGLGRDDTSFDLFKRYLDTMTCADKRCVIDADGLYHLATWQNTVTQRDSLAKAMLGQSHRHCYLTPHSAEAARLLDNTYKDIDKDKIRAIGALSDTYGGNWLLKGAQTLVLESDYIDICGLGNAGMATAGMGDCLAGLIASLLAQGIDAPMLTAVLIHAKAGDNLAGQVGEYALSANHMAAAIGEVINQITVKLS